MIKDEHKTKKQLIAELKKWQRKITELENSETELKRIVEALKDSETMKQALLDASIDRIRVVDEDMRILWANKTTTEGWSHSGRPSNSHLPMRRGGR